MTTRLSFLAGMCLFSLLICSLLAPTDAFAVGPPSSFLAATTSTSSACAPSISTRCNSARPSLTSMQALPIDTAELLSGSVPDSSLTVAAATLDPTVILSNILGAFLNGPLILAVPIVAALSVAGVIVWFIVSYASPTEDE